MPQKKVAVSNLTEVPTTFLITLVARARGGKEFPELKFNDATSERIIKEIDRDLDPFYEHKGSVFGILKRTQIFKECAINFFKTYPRSTGVCLGCGLSDYFQWLDNGKNSWVDFDLPESMAVRSKLIQYPERHRNIEGSLADVSWWSCLGLNDTDPCLLICEGVLMYLEPKNVNQILRTFGERAAPGSILLFDHMCWLAIGRAKNHPAVKAVKAEFKWGPRRYEELTSPHAGLKINNHYSVMEAKGLPYSVLGPVFRFITKMDFYAISEIQKV